MESGLSADTDQEKRVQIKSKKQVVEQMNRYKELLKTVLDGQADMAADTKRVLLEELEANFEAAVRANVLVKGQTWDEAPDAEAEDEALDLESLLDDTIVETTRRRRTFPKRILPHVVHSIKAEHRLMELYQQKYKAEEAPKDLDRERVMNSLSAEAPAMVESAIQIVKSISTLQEQAQGLCQILSMKTSDATLEVHREVFGQSGAAAPSVMAAARSRQPRKRAVEEADCYRKRADEEGCPQ
ncbi:kinetochore-associated protein NSL1 homolog [Betta splendens]|uniref:Kinetochore-associated protein NSL1 homolog n=1 Tax=Betta splendens TaxID=158456 RepID=A0A6P7LQ07_BETSP|nr:kinetochore-associated protein NSL1 homolog [Betta splendens]